MFYVITNFLETVLSLRYINNSIIILFAYISQVNVEKLNFFYVLEPGDRRVSPIGSELNKAMLKVIRMIKENRGNNNPPQKVFK